MQVVASMEGLHPRESVVLYVMVALWSVNCEL